MRILFAGDGPLATQSLNRILREDFEVTRILLSQEPSDESLERCAADAAALVSQPTDVNSDELLDVLRKDAPDLGVSVGYGQILGPRALDLPSEGFVNFHGGDLPDYRGRDALRWAILNGETTISMTAHWMDEGIDTGDILLQYSISISRTDTWGDAFVQMVQKMPELVSETLRGIQDGSLTSKPQKGMGTYFPTIRPKDRWLDWGATSEELYNKVRALTWPDRGAWTLVGGEPIIVWEAHYNPDWPSYNATPGAVVGKEEDGVFVKTGDSVIFVREVETRDGDAHTPRFSIGTRLGLEPLKDAHEARVSGDPFQDS